MRMEAMRALYEGSLAEPGDVNPYAGKSLVLAKCWMRGYMRMLRVRVDTSPARARYLEAQAAAKRSRNDRRGPRIWNSHGLLRG